MNDQQQRVQQAKDYLKSHYGEETVSMLLTHDGVEEGTGAMTVECTVKIGLFTSDWRKTFRFRDGQIVGMSYLPRVKLLRKWHRRNAWDPSAS